MLSERQKNYRLYDSIYRKFLVKAKLQRQRAYQWFLGSGERAKIDVKRA